MGQDELAAASMQLRCQRRVGVALSSANFGRKSVKMRH